eukprot:Sspe_Gene.42468::Locus_20612_Transcript_1_4_Confidence_0.429_Length_2344::g.42468::m.42468
MHRLPLPLLKLGEELRRVALELLYKQTLFCDLRLCLPVSRTAHTQPHRATSPMTGQPDDPHVMAKVFPPKLRTHPQLPCHVKDALLPLQVPEGTPVVISTRGEVVEVPCTRELHSLQSHLSRQTTDDEGKVVRRAGCGTKSLDVLVKELLQGLFVEQGFGALVEEGLVRGPTPLGEVQEVVLVPFGGVQLDLGREVSPRILLFEHCLWGYLRVPQITTGVGVVHPSGDPLRIVSRNVHILPALPNHNGRPRVLARWEDTRCSDVGIFEKLQRHELVVGCGLIVLQDVGELLEVGGAQEVAHIPHRMLREQAEPLGLDTEYLPVPHVYDTHMIRRELVVFCGVGGSRLEDVLVGKGLGHPTLLHQRAHTALDRESKAHSHGAARHYDVLRGGKGTTHGSGAGPFAGHRERKVLDGQGRPEHLEQGCGSEGCPAGRRRRLAQHVLGGWRALESSGVGGNWRTRASVEVSRGTPVSVALRPLWCDLPVAPFADSGPTPVTYTHHEVFQVALLLPL